ncbi:MAG: cytochrome c biogenesis protein CcsA [Pirellulales bacterium]|nr:cytochrome c biogenesis protein CcsA [Pirellulales bacterium]
MPTLVVGMRIAGKHCNMPTQAWAWHPTNIICRTTMLFISQLGLLAAFCSLGYAVLGCTIGLGQERRRLLRSGEFSACLGVGGLTIVSAVLAWALAAKDFQFAYVAQYSSLDLSWYYSLSAFWVGQSGSLLLWAWMLGISAIIFRFWPSAQPSQLKKTAFAIILFYLFCLVAVLLFAADPTLASIGSPQDGRGLGPSLQHPVMLIHPPIVFLGYAAWTIPYALAVAGMILGKADADWLRQSRSWAIFAWSLLGAGIVLGGLWAYEELGWGGYWGWDPVENGSLLPWLMGTAFVHAGMAWRSRGMLKKTAISSAIATFAFCNFAAFITRSGFFSSLHAFNQSPLGWMFLILMAGVVLGGCALLARRWAALAPERPLSSVWAREWWIGIFILLLILLALVTLFGTMAAPVSGILLGRQYIVEAAFYNKALIPIGLLLLLATALAPLLRWGNRPASSQKKALAFSAGAAMAAIFVAFFAGVRHPLALAVAGLASFAVAAFAGSLALDVRVRKSGGIWRGLLSALRGNRRQYAGFLTHLGLISLAVGIAGSSLGTDRREAVMHEGENQEWSGWTIKLAGVTQRNLSDKIVVEAKLEVTRGGQAPYFLRPTQNLFKRTNEWVARVAVHSTWKEDLYVIMHGGEADGQVNLTFVENPLMRWIWFGGCLLGLGAVLGLMPSRRIAKQRLSVPAPHANMASAIRQPLSARDSHG